jgi:phosphate transport system permease protein
MKKKAEKTYAVLVRTAGFLQIFLLFAIAGVLFRESRPALSQFHFNFFVSSSWDPVNEIFGGLVFVVGTLATSLIALLIAVPLSLLSALFVTQYVPKGLSSTLAFLVSLLAAVPSIIYGLWGVFVLVPFLRNNLEGLLNRWFAFNFFGVSVLSAGLILAIMIIPTITSLTRELFRATPEIYKECALALGSTRWEAIHYGVLGISWRSLFGASLLGLGRALGETMAVTMVIGNANRFPPNLGEHPFKYLFSPSNTMASLIANEYGEAMAGSVHLSSLFLIGLGLLVVSLVTNAIARAIVSERKIVKQKRALKA